MKKTFGLFAISLSAILALGSCSKDNDNRQLGYTYGELSSVTEKDYTIKSDAGNTIKAVNSVKPSFTLENGQRVFAEIEILSQQGKDINASVWSISKILTKEPIYFSKMTDKEQQEVGNDPIEVSNAWFSNGRYLNIQFITLRADNLTPHFINLKVDEENSTKEKVIVEFRHNDYDEPRNTRASGIVSFDVRKLVPEGKDKIEIEMKWTSYNGMKMSDKGTFELSKVADKSLFKAKDAQSAAMKSTDR